MTNVKSPDDTPELIEARATVNLAGPPRLRPGYVVTVDPTQPYIAALLKTRRLVPEEGAQ